MHAWQHLKLSAPAVVEQEVAARKPVGGGEYGPRFGGRPVRGGRPLIAVGLLPSRVPQ